MKIFVSMATSYGLVGAFILVAIIMWVSYTFAGLLKQKRMGSAIAIMVALVVAFIGGKITGGEKGISDIAMFGGVGLLGGGMMRDYTIVSTAYGVKVENLKKAGLAGTVALVFGIVFSFIVGVVIAWLMGYRDPAELATIGAGVETFVVGPVTGAALGVSSDVIALSIAAGVVKSVVAMILTPLVAEKLKINNPTGAMIFGGLIGSTSGVAGGLAATDASLVPYGAMVATFYTGLGCLLTPTVLALVTNMIF
ncbi:malonate transporter subunit MadM [Clostridiaceae bacterium]|nr:malonate transporter subunit MadM [Clostridiaceae bacterium]RKI09448.1 malonate transporter subunit MadM [bacterium 1XD21-70]